MSSIRQKEMSKRILNSYLEDQETLDNFKKLELSRLLDSVLPKRRPLGDGMELQFESGISTLSVLCIINSSIKNTPLECLNKLVQLYKPELPEGFEYTGLLLLPDKKLTLSKLRELHESNHKWSTYSYTPFSVGLVWEVVKK